MTIVRRILFASTIVIASLEAANAAAVDDLHCTFRHPVEEVGAITDLPPQIQKAMLARMAPAAHEDAKFEWHRVMAPRDGNFNATDAITPGLPSRRFIRAGHVGTEWFIWFERGGLAYRKKIALFHLRLGHEAPIVRAFVSYDRQDPCAMTDALLDSAPSVPGANDGW